LKSDDLYVDFLIFIVTDDEVCRIARILAFDTVAVIDREKVYGMLGLNLADLPDMKRRLVQEYSGSYEFYTWSKVPTFES
jgi:hypothetical protein